MGEINFLSSYLDIKRKKRMKVLHVFFFLMALLLPMLTIYGINTYRRDYYSQQLANLERNLNSEELIAKVEHYNTSKKKLEILEQYYHVIYNVNQQIMQISHMGREVLEKIEGTFPQDVFIKVFISTLEGISMQGTAKDRIAIAEFQHNLKNLELFEVVHVNILSQESLIEDTIIFDIKCTFKGGDDDEVK